MAEKNIIIQRKKSDGTYDQYYPKTKVENVEGAETPQEHRQRRVQRRGWWQVNLLLIRRKGRHNTIMVI